MKMQPGRLPKKVILLGIAAVGLWACGTSNDGNGGTGGSGKGGTTSTGGGSGGSSGGTTGSGGSSASGGSKGTGGAQGTGGKTTGTGGSGDGGAKGTGGAAGGTQGSDASIKGTGGSGDGGTNEVDAGPARTGGTTGMRRDGGPGTGTGGKTGGTGGTAGSTTTTPGDCQKGQTKGSEVVIMGESFYALSPQYIQNRIQDNARKAGSLGASDTYRNVAVSGQTMNYVATTEWPNAAKSTVKYVIMDGGGIDCMSSSCSTCPGDFTTLLGKMATAGVLDVIYTRYPEPGSPPGSNTTLKGNLDTLMPKMQTVCEGTTSPRCHWVDLRPVWQTNDVQSDGLHPTQSGGDHVGDLIWSEMQKDCIAQ